MKIKVIIFFGIFVVLIVAILMINKTPERFVVKTFNVYNEKRISKKVIFLDTVLIKASTDDFIESIEKKNGDYIEPETVLLKMESNEENYELAKSKNEYAISLLNSGKAIQEEKLQAVKLAEKKLENTMVKSPIEGYIVNIPVNQKIFVSKGTVLIEMLPINSNAYVKITSEEKKLLNNAEYIEILLSPIEKKWLLSERHIIEQNNFLYLLITLDVESIDRELLNSLYCEMQITYVEDQASWIPNDFVNDHSVFLDTEKEKEIEILDQKNDLLLVKGLKDEDILIKKR